KTLAEEPGLNAVHDGPNHLLGRNALQGAHPQHAVRVVFANHQDHTVYLGLSQIELGEHARPRRSNRETRERVLDRRRRLMPSACIEQIRRTRLRLASRQKEEIWERLDAADRFLQRGLSRNDFRQTGTGIDAEVTGQARTMQIAVQENYIEV